MKATTGLLRALLFVAGATIAAQAPTALGSTRTLKFSNRTPHARTEHGVATIPFNPGEFFGAQDLTLNGFPIFVRPFGRRYSDGSYRYAEAIAQVTVPAAVGGVPGATTQTLGTTPLPPPFVGYQPGPNTIALAGLPAPLNQHALVLLINGAPKVFDLLAPVGAANGPQSVVDDGPRRTSRYIGRQGDFVYTLYAYMWGDHLTWELRVTNSGYWPGPGTSGSTGTQFLSATAPAMYLATFMNCDIAMYGESGHQPLGIGGYPGASYSNTAPGGNFRMGHRASLSPTQSAFGFDLGTLAQGYTLTSGTGDWGDGQSQVWRGSLSVPQWNLATLAATYSNEGLANMTHPLIGMCQEWQSTAAYGPQGYIAPGSRTDAQMAPKLADFTAWLGKTGTYANDTVNLWERYVQGPGGAKIGLLPYNGATGDQPDFGILEHWDCFASGSPHAAEAAGYSGYHSTRRSVHRYNGPDASTGQQIVHATEASHPEPNQMALYGTRHFHVSSQTTFFKDTNTPHNTNGWNGWKLSHMSINHLYTAYLLNPWSQTLAEELDFHKEAWLFQNPDPHQSQTWLNHYGEARAVGRSYFAMAQIAIARGLDSYANGSLLHRLHYRTEDCVLRISTPGSIKQGGLWPLRQSMWGGLMAPGRISSVTGGRSNVNLCGPDPNIPGNSSQNSTNSFYPWEDQIGPYGMWAAYLLTLEDGQSASYGTSHALAAMMLAGPLLEYCTMWSTSANPTYNCTGPTAPTLFQQSNPTTPQWLRIAYRCRWLPDANGYGIPPSASDVVNHWYFDSPNSSGFNLWCSPTVYLLKSQIPRLGTVTGSEINAYINFVQSTTYDQRWRWGP